MTQPAKFDPPDSVVGPAFGELLDRLRRARLSNSRTGEITAEERKAFEYGVAERKSVLGHSLFLVFAQWAVYKQAISRLKSRTVRLTYAMGTIISTVLFIQRRAVKVSKDTFAHIVTTNMDSTLGNEARIILAELEGPLGPYFLQTCRDHNFDTEFTTVPMDDEQPDLHPQLRLKPRLMTEMPSHPLIRSSNREAPQKEAMESSRRRKWRDMQPTPRVKRGVDEREVPQAGKAIDFRGLERTIDPIPEADSGANSEVEKYERMSDLFTKSDDIEHSRGVDIGKERKLTGDATGEGDVDGLWGEPFDFATAAEKLQTFTDDADDEPLDRHSSEEYRTMTPSQRRAAERRRRRVKALRGTRTGNFD